MPRRRKKRIKHKIKNLIILCIALGIFFSGVFLLWISTFPVPTLDTFDERKVVQSTKIYDRTGEVLLYDVFQDVKRTVVPFEDISQYVKNATIAIEDTEFYEHFGIKPTSILRAVWVNITNLGYSQGASTITQQVVKNSLLNKEKTISRKLKEWVLAIRLEGMLSKDEILHLYLNEIPYGGSIYGIQEASSAFFNKDAEELTVAESAYLAALPKAPTFYSPYGNNRDRLELRKDLVLSEMLENGFISQEEHDEALLEEIIFQARAETGIKAPHFVFHVLEELEYEFGRSFVEEQGLKVTTTLDWDLQKEAEEIVKEHALRNVEAFNAENAALVALDSQNGQVLTMVGSRDYFDDEIDGNFNITTAHRQPGSVFKPFAYAQAFIKGFTPDTILFDTQTEFSAGCDPARPKDIQTDCYRPVNYTSIFKGPLTMRNALAQSINIPAVKTLYLADLSDTLRLVKDMGISTLTNIHEYGLTLVLGGGEVSPLEVAGAYATFANEGVRNKTESILKIENSDGDTIKEYSQKEKTVLPREVALQISSILSDNEARTPAFGANSLLNFNNYEVAVKTGTTNDFKDAWISGYTPNITVTAWAGNNNNTSMVKKSASTIVAPLWNAFMREALPHFENTPFPLAPSSPTEVKPVLRGEWQGGEVVNIDTISGKLATEFTPEETIKEIYLGGTHSILHWLYKDDPYGLQPTNPERDSQYDNWEYGVSKWAEQNLVQNIATSSIPTEYDDVHRPEFSPTFNLSSPNENFTYPANQKITLSIDNYQGKYPLGRIEYFLNSKYIGRVDKAPFLFSIVPGEIEGVSHQNSLTVSVYDSVLNKRTTHNTLEISF
jgi:1A family penicillin-binding protein